MPVGKGVEAHMTENQLIINLESNDQSSSLLGYTNISFVEVSAWHLQKPRISAEHHPIR
jgi:hypothetical protein